MLIRWHFEEGHEKTIFETCCGVANSGIQEGSPWCPRRGTRKSSGRWQGSGGSAMALRKRGKLRLKKTRFTSTTLRKMRRMLPSEQKATTSKHILGQPICNGRNLPSGRCPRWFSRKLGIDRTMG
jgi:hypothetical protein